MEDKVEAAKEAINEVFSDMSVSPEQTKESLEELVEYINDMIITLE